MAPRGPSEDPKVTALREPPCLNPHPDQVPDDAVLAAGSTPKAADSSARERGKEENPSLSLRPSPGHAAAEPGPSPPGPDAGQAHVPDGVPDARYEQLRHAALHARATAFPLGLGVLTSKGVTAWRRALARLTCAPAAGTTPAPSPAARPPGPPPGPAATELVHALAGLAVALAGT